MVPARSIGGPGASGSSVAWTRSANRSAAAIAASTASSRVDLGTRSASGSAGASARTSWIIDAAVRSRRPGPARRSCHRSPTVNDTDTNSRPSMSGGTAGIDGEDAQPQVGVARDRQLGCVRVHGARHRGGTGRARGRGDRHGRPAFGMVKLGPGRTEVLTEQQADRGRERKQGEGPQSPDGCQDQGGDQQPAGPEGDRQAPVDLPPPPVEPGGQRGGGHQRRCERDQHDPAPGRGQRRRRSHRLGLLHGVRPDP